MATIVAFCRDGVEQSYQLGLTHVCVILSRRRDTITSARYYVSSRRDTSFGTLLEHRQGGVAYVHFSNSSKVDLIFDIFFIPKYQKLFLNVFKPSA